MNLLISILSVICRVIDGAFEIVDGLEGLLIGLSGVWYLLCVAVAIAGAILRVAAHFVQLFAH